MIALAHPRRIEGYAIVSEDGMLANAAGIMPDSLKFEPDQRFFESGLDETDLVVHGHLTMTELGAREGMKVSSVAKLLPLAFLAPDIVEAFLAGDQSATLVAHRLIRSNLPVLWKQQRAEILA